jgi:hypothetical protein
MFSPMANNDELERFAKRTYLRTDDQGNQVMGIKSSNPGLTVNRLRRCQNCIHFDIGEKAMSYFNHCVDRDRKNLRDQGCDEAGIEEHIQSINRGIRDRLGVVGVCQAKDKRTDDDAHGDFTAFHFQCNTWTGRMIVTPEEAAADPSAAEVMANLKKVEGS